MENTSPAGTAQRKPHTRVSLRVHCIFSTKNRRPSIPDDLQPRAWAFIGGIARNLGITAIAVGGVADHVHILLLLPPTMPLAEAIQKIKANSSRWLREQSGKAFQWQGGYAAFSVSISHTGCDRGVHLESEKTSREKDIRCGVRRHPKKARDGGMILPSLAGLGRLRFPYPALTCRAGFWRTYRHLRAGLDSGVLATASANPRRTSSPQSPTLSTAARSPAWARPPSCPPPSPSSETG